MLPHGLVALVNWGVSVFLQSDTQIINLNAIRTIFCFSLLYFPSDLFLLFILIFYLYHFIVSAECYILMLYHKCITLVYFIALHVLFLFMYSAGEHWSSALYKSINHELYYKKISLECINTNIVTDNVFWFAIINFRLILPPEWVFHSRCDSDCLENMHWYYFLKSEENEWTASPKDFVIIFGRSLHYPCNITNVDV